MNPEAASVVHRSGSEEELGKTALESGFKPRRLSAALRGAAGVTSQAEVTPVL